MISLIKIIGTNDIHKQYLNREIDDVSIVKNSQNAILFLLNEPDIKEIFINPNCEITLTQEGFIIEGHAIIKDNFGKLAILIKKYK